MFKHSIYYILALFFLIPSSTSFAWQHEIQFGYGYGKEIDEPNHNYGYFLNGKFYKFNKLDRKLILTLDATLAHWLADTTENRHLTVAGVSAAFRGYFIVPERYRYRPYIQATFGPMYLSANKFGFERQGHHFAFQTTFGIGIEIGNHHHSLDMELLFIHYCNAGIFYPNAGIDIPLVYTLGFQF